MLSIVSLVLTAVGYVLFFWTEAVVLPIVMILISAGIGLAVLIPFYFAEKLAFSDFFKTALQTHYGSVIAVVGALFLILLPII